MTEKQLRAKAHEAMDKYLDAGGTADLVIMSRADLERNAPKQTTTNNADELRPNYCFWCGAYGRGQLEFCANCSYKIGTYPPEIETLITQAQNKLLREILEELPEKEEHDKNNFGNKCNPICHNAGKNDAIHTITATIKSKLGDN